VDAEHSVLVKAAEEGDAAGFAGELLHLVDGGLHQRVGEADLAVELDDARAQGEAAAGGGLDEARVLELREVAVGAGARESQRLGGLRWRPGGTSGGEEAQDVEDAVGARHGGILTR
jgi:hypothetical protein